MAKSQSKTRKQLKPAILQKIFQKREPSAIQKPTPPTAIGKRALESLAATTSAIESPVPSKRFLKNSERRSAPPSSPFNDGDSTTTDQQTPIKQKKESQVEKMRNRLSVGQFRFISEQLYTQPSTESSNLFGDRPELFHAYQRGYLRQQRQWPSNPLDAIISELQQEIKVIEECGGSKGSPFVIADFGCGEARLARTLLSKKTKNGNTENAASSSVASPSSANAKFSIHSFDFVAANEHVQACDMAHTSLSDCSVDVVIFCLSLMGTNIHDFLVEANRVLKNGGRLRIAEVRSRFESVAKFIKKLKNFGFKLMELRGTDAAAFFTHFTFVKVSGAKRTHSAIKLAPCVYKKR